MAANPQYAIQVRPTEYLKDPGSYGWIAAADGPATGLNIPVTNFVELDAAEAGDACTAVKAITNVIKASAGMGGVAGGLWKVTSDGGSKAVSMPQRGVETGTTNAWFLNICCLQGTLGQIAAQILYHPALMKFQDQLFPRLQKDAYSSDEDNLGAWQIALEPTPPSSSITRTAALTLRLRIIQELTLIHI